MPETIAFIDRYASMISAPVRTQTVVTSVRKTDTGYLVSTDQGDWQCRTVVLATGECNIPRIPKFADELPSTIARMTPMEYRNTDQLGEGGVLIVGASATGIQLSEEIHSSVRPVTLAVGEHIRAPRVYRGRDIEWWMDATGVLDERYDEVDDIVRARKVPSLQLTGSPKRKTLDLNALTNMGVKLIGRFSGIQGDKGQFSGSLRNQCVLSDLKMNRLLGTIDEWATENNLDGEVEAPHRLPPTEVENAPPLSLDFTNGGVSTIIWATGFRPDYSWLKVPVFDHKGRISHDGGIVDSPGMYLMGIQFLRRRKSVLLDGAGDDARDLSDHIVSYLAH